MQKITVGEILTWVKGKKPTLLFEVANNNLIPYLSASYFRTKKPDYYVDVRDKNCISVNNDEVVLIWDGSNAGDVFRGLKGVLSSTMVKFNKSDKCNTDFLYFLLKSNFKNLNKQTTGSTIPHVNGSVLKNIEIPITNILEQKSIARVLTTVQDAIAGQEELIAKLKELKRNMMQYLFTHGTKGEKTKMTEIGEIPESWDILRLGDLCEVKGGKRLPKGEKLVSVNTGFPYIRVTDFCNNSVDLSNILYLKPETQKAISRYMISVKDVYISIAGSIGFVGIIPNELNGANLTENAAKLCIKVNNVRQRFLMYWLASDQAQKNIKSQTVKNAQPKLALARIQSIPCIIPAIEEQGRVVNMIDSIRAKNEMAQKKLSVYQNLFKTLLYELMSGERRAKK